MYRSTIIIVALSLCVLLTPRTHAKTDADSSANKNTGELKLVVTLLDINDKVLKLSYDIKNDSEDDAWILVETGLYAREFTMRPDVFMAEDGKTLMIRKRFGLPLAYITSVPTYGKYVRLRSGESQTESVFITIPVYPVSITERARRKEQGLEHATRLSIELGYYTGNLPERIFKKLKQLENTSPESSTFSRGFNLWQERLISRDEEVSIPHDYRALKHDSEQVLRTVVDNLRIPYEEKQYLYHPVTTEPPDLTSCTKIEIRYQHSMLEYFYPYASQRRLMSTEEKEYLQSETLVVDNPEDIKTIARRFRKASAFDSGIVVRYRSYADEVCYYDDKPPMSFPIYGDYAIMSKADRLICFAGFPSLAILIPNIRAIDLRTQCAANLKNQWYRFRFYNLHEARRRNDPSLRVKTIYPTPTEWCDAMLRRYPTTSSTPSAKMDDWPHICPSAGGGKNHYAMNPNCKPDSPPDTVLLFGTKDGWNQHGGPELFTFDNHNPKGGCVLLNDGTVKFIRTKEELQQLRWQ